MPSNSTWFWSELWFAWLWTVTIIVLGCVLFVIAKNAVTRARPEDLPEVVASFGTFVSKLASWLPRRSEPAEPAEDGTVKTTALGSATHENQSCKHENTRRGAP